jgi:two-component system OmpR family response regulator
VEDEKNSSLIVKGFRQDLQWITPFGNDGLHLTLTEPYDASIIDIMLPKLDGLSLIDEMRHQK